jgi:hypothetical protein
MLSAKALRFPIQKRATFPEEIYVHPTHIPLVAGYYHTRQITSKEERDEARFRDMQRRRGKNETFLIKQEERREKIIIRKRYSIKSIQNVNV